MWSWMTNSGWWFIWHNALSKIVELASSLCVDAHLVALWNSVRVFWVPCLPSYPDASSNFPWIGFTWLWQRDVLLLYQALIHRIDKQEKPPCFPFSLCMEISVMTFMRSQGKPSGEGSGFSLRRSGSWRRRLLWPNALSTQKGIPSTSKMGLVGRRQN